MRKDLNMGNKRKVTSEEDLNAFKKEDDYERTRKILNHLTNVMIIAMWCTLLVVIVTFITSEDFRNFVITELRNNLIAIILFSIQALGLKSLINKNKS